MVGRERLILLTGASGYVGGRLLQLLEQRGERVRCLARRPEYLRERVRPNTEVVEGDVLDPASRTAALTGVDTAYYLVHSMGTAGSFEDEDRQAAQHFGAAARAAGVRRIIYLGGLGDEQADLSPHLRSRHEVGRLLRAAGVPVIEFRASIVLGSGSLSFEMIRALTERLPVMIAPRWVSTPAQPIAIQDLLAYLASALDHPVVGSKVYEIGGRSRVSYGDLMHEYARQRRLRRLILPVPLLTPRLSSLWLGLVTPLYARVGRKLIESMRHPTVVRDDAALRDFAIRPLNHRDAIAAALRNEDQALMHSRWSDALSAGGSSALADAGPAGNGFVDSRSAETPVPPAQAFAPIRRIGGASGWYYGDGLWRFRGLLDLLVGGVGIRRGRRDPEVLRVGDAVDCWRVTAFEPDRRLLLRAEMNLPGRAWLEFVVEPSAHGSTIRQTAIFDPVGLLGRAYWYLVAVLHHRIFSGMLRNIVRAGQVKRAGMVAAGRGRAVRRISRKQAPPRQAALA
ncbi:MAG: SDR family oxidoreductase [Planctomycetia bacterium]|nr:SDR family oxidoreductase [Planctomycetia bacterium]